MACCLIRFDCPTVEISDANAKDWIENRLARQLIQLINIEGKSVVAKMGKVTELRVEVNNEQVDC